MVLVQSPKELVQGLEDLEVRWCVETNQYTVLLKSARIVRRVLEIWRNYSDSSGKPLADAGLKNVQLSKIKRKW